jgi:hypothetical protein
MRRVRYSVAMSVDGSIAGQKGECSRRRGSARHTVELGVIPALLGAARKVMAGCENRVELVERPSKPATPGHRLLTFDVVK